MKKQLYSLFLALLLVFVSHALHAQKAIFDQHVGRVSTVAAFPTSPRTHPNFMLLDKTGNLYVAVEEAYQSYWRTLLFKVTPAGKKQFIAGSGTQSEDGVGAKASFSGIGGMAFDSKGNLFLTDNELIRKVTSEGAVTTVVDLLTAMKDKSSPFYKSGGLGSLRVDSKGNFILTHKGQICKVTPEGSVSIIAGEAFNKKIKDDSQLLFYDSEFLIESDTIFISSSKGYMKVTMDGIVTPSLARVKMENYKKGYQDGPADKARINGWAGYAMDKEGNIFISNENYIRKIRPDGYVTTIAGRIRKVTDESSTTSGFKDGPANEALFNNPLGLAIDNNGDLLILDNQNCSIRKLTLK